MYLSTDTIQKLMWICNHLDNKPEDEHDMELFTCGTASCALGDHMIKINTPCEIIAFKDIFDRPLMDKSKQVCKQYDFLFSCFPEYSSYRSGEKPKTTAKRIRKFLYYFMRKNEIFPEYNNTLQTGKHLYQEVFSLDKISGEKCEELELLSA